MSQENIDNREDFDSRKDEAMPVELTSTPVRKASRPAANAGISFWNTRYGVIQSGKEDDVIAHSLAQYGEWSEQELDTIGALLDEGSIALQYGAEYGAQTLYFSNLVGSTGQVHVVEPRRLEHIALCNAVALNTMRNVYPHHLALDKEPGRIALPVSSSQPEERVQAVSLDSLELPALHLLKLNPPACLIPVLAGAAETVREHKPAIYFRLSTMELAVDEVAALKALGYRCWSHLPYLYNRVNHASNKLNVFPGWTHRNVIAVHRDTPAEFEHLPEL